jgi:acetylornithine deacetylase/succinyl-diaminopimelate desuccinylase-like protein
MKRLRSAGYKLVMHAHDEVCAEIPIGQGSVEEFERLLVDTRVLPGASALDVRDELRDLLRKVGVPGEVEWFLYRPGFEAKGIEPLVQTIRRCHAQVFPTPLQTVSPAVSSMWRNANAFNELGIPALSVAGFAGVPTPLHLGKIWWIQLPSA